MRKTGRYFIAAVAVTIGLIGCSSNNTSVPTAAMLSTDYKYTAYDPAGTVLATGSMTLAFEGTAVTGQRDIKGNAPESGTGAVSGEELADGTVQIIVNPGSAATVLLQGKIVGDGVTGARLLDTGDPPANRTIGRFTLTVSSPGPR